MRRMTTWKQVERMRKAWPGFRVLHRTRCDVRWRGQLRPFCQTYTVQVTYHLEPDRRIVDGSLPQVTVINPLLHRRKETPCEPIPHHYPNRAYPELPFLCLYDPDTREWRPGCAIAGTIVLGLLSGWPVMKAGLQPANGWVAGDTPVAE